MNPPRPTAAAVAPGGYYAAYGTPAPATTPQQQQQYAAPHQQQQQQHAANAPATAAYAAYVQAWQAQQQRQQSPATSGHLQQPQQQPYYAGQQAHYAAPAPAPAGGYTTTTAAAAAAAVAPAAYAHYAHPQQPQPQAPPAVSYHQQYPQPQQYQQQPQQQQQQQQPALTLPLLATPQQPLPAAPGQTLGAYAYPGAGAGGGVAAAPAAAVGQQQQPQQQQPQQQLHQQPAVTPQQVAQEAIAKTMAAMQQQQEQQLQPGQVLDNRRGYIHGNLIGQMEKARLERAAIKNENYVRRKDEIARRKRLGLPLDGLIDKKQLVAAAAGGGEGKGGGGAGRANPPPRQPAGGGGGGQSRAGIGTAGAKPQNTSVYIAGLPSDVSQAKIELVFSQYGAVKRTKVYRNDAGEAKGDGLVTYAKPASVDLAIAKLNGHAISVGHPISVSMADFNRTKSGAGEEPPWQQQQQQQQQQQEQQQQGNGQQNGAAANPDADTGGSGEAGGYAEGGLPPLPEECNADKHPVVVLRSVYTREESESDPDFFADLEADMLMECVKFGTVISVTTPEAPGYFGCVVVTFDTSSGANKCAEAMHGRWFDQRQIEALVAGNEVPDKEEKQNGPENFQQPQRQQAEEHQGGANGEKKEEDMGPLLQGVPDSPPPTDLNSFLESV